MRLVDAGSEEILVEADLVVGFLPRMRGLLGRAVLPAGHGILLSAKQVHTIGMRFGIDAVYLSRDYSVMRIVTLRPGRFGPFEFRAKWILEIGAGESERLGIREGMSLGVRP